MIGLFRPGSDIFRWPPHPHVLEADRKGTASSPGGAVFLSLTHGFCSIERLSDYGLKLGCICLLRRFDSSLQNNVRARQKLRDAYVAYAKAHPKILIGGGLKPEPVEPFCGALLVVEVPTKADVEQVIAGDPFFVPEHRTYEIFTWARS